MQRWNMRSWRPRFANGDPPSDPQRRWNQRNDSLSSHSSVCNVHPGRRTLWHCGHGEPLAVALTAVTDALLAMSWWFKVGTRWNTIVCELREGIPEKQPFVRAAPKSPPPACPGQLFKKVSKSIWPVLATTTLKKRGCFFLAFLSLRSWVELSSAIWESDLVTPHIPSFRKHFLPPHQNGSV